MEHTMNRTPKEIIEMFNNTDNDVRETIRNYFSRQLMDTNENNKLEVDIVVDADDAMGLSSLELPNIIRMWQHPSEGWITFETYGGGFYDFDDFSTRELIQIMNDFSLSYEK